MERGNLNGTYTGITVPNADREYVLDAVGNWTITENNWRYAPSSRGGLGLATLP